MASVSSAASERRFVPLAREILLQRLVVTGTRGQPPAAGRLLQHEAADVRLQLALDLVELRRDGLAPFVERLHQIVDLHRLVGDEENGLYRGT